MAQVLNPAVDATPASTHAVLGADVNNTGLLQLSPDVAESFYREECRNTGVSPNNTFTRQLLAGATVFNFDNGYLGGRGIIPILSTLQRLPVVELSMRNCEITTEDVSLIQKTFASHDTFCKIDLRGVTLSVASARKLLTLAVQNPHVTQILLDESTPKFVYIQKQCVANANSTILTSRCLMCNKPIVYSPDQKLESRLLLSFAEELNAMQPALTGVALQVMFRCILACCDVADGVLFLCSCNCQMQLTSDIVTAMRAGVCEWFSGDVATCPRTPLLRRCVADTLKILRGKGLQSERNVVGAQGDTWETRNNHNKKGDDCNDGDDDASSNSSSEKKCDAELEQCTICGTRAVCLPNAALLTMQHVFKDIEVGFSLRPSAFLRLVKLMISYTDLRPCSLECVRHLVRYGFCGYGGVVRSRVASGYPCVSSLDISLKCLPHEEFAILNFSTAHIDEVEEEETSCALTVASAMSDIDGVTIDPYMIFAAGRHLEQLPAEALGMELRSACEAVQVVGCLPAGVGPFDRRKGKPPRHLYVSWDKWEKHTDIDTIVRVAFSRRRQGVYIIDGPHGNLFDNTRAALWAFRTQRRAVLIAMEFSLDWLTLPNGVVPNESSLKQSFLTTFKVVGQTNIENSIYVICQGNFGPRVGHYGFFYIPRGIFNLHVSGDAFIFIDATPYATGRGEKLSLYAAQMLPKEVVELVEQAPLLQELFCHLNEALNWKTRHRLDCTKVVCEAICHLPPPIFDLFCSCDRNASENQVELLRTVWRHVVSGNSRSILLFYLHKVLGPLAVRWMHALSRELVPYSPFPVLMQKNAESPVPGELERKQGQLQWVLLTVLKKMTAKVPERTVWRPVKKSSQRRRVKTVEDKKTNRESRDMYWAKLGQRWVVEREKRELLKELWHTTRGNSASCTRHTLMMSTTANLLKPQPFMHGSDAFPLELVGHPWHCVRLCDVDGRLREHAMFFIRDHACCFNLENQTITTPLSPILKSQFAHNFLFSTGFDCVLHSPVNPRTAYFFCGEQWFQWDTYHQLCTGGPFQLRFHPQFRALPSEFLCRIDAAMAVPGTSYVLFFSQLKYVVFDLNKQQPVGDVRRIGDWDGYERDIPIFDSHLAKLFPNGPMTTLLQCAEGGEKGKKNGDTKAKSEVINEVGNNAKLSAMLIGRDGRVAVVHGFASTTSTMITEEVQTLPVSSLSRLPLALRQMTTAALHTICKDALDAECSRCGVVVNNTQHGTHQINAIHSTLTRQREELEILFTLKGRGVDQTLMPLLRDEVVFVQTEESMLGEGPQVVEVDYGPTRPVAFGMLVVVLDTSHIDSRVFLVAPIETVVESSDDGVMYTRHTHFVATPCVTAICWGEVHAARFWRLRFLSRLPVGTGIARTLWYEISCIPRAIPLKPVVSFVPPESTKVNIIAPRVFCAPEELIKCQVPPEHVFTSSLSSGWWKKHCILPAFSAEAFCLFFSGDNFVEFDCEHNSVVSHRAISLASHPAFAKLPHPFSMGFNAVFYPNRGMPHIVALVHDNDIILWNMLYGCKENNINGTSPDSFFKGLPWRLDEVENIVQIWDKPSEVFVIRSPQVLRWNINTAELLEGPMQLQECLYFYHPEFEGKRILSVTSFPTAPERYYVFCEDCVAVQTVTDGTVLSRVGPMPVRNFDLFSSMTWYLKWGLRRYDSVISIDFKEEQPLLTGVQIRSSEPCDEDWLIEYSDDGVQWSAVGYHHQSSVRSCTMWSLASVEHCSHRLWRLTTDASKRHDMACQTVFYTSVVFLTLPSAPYRQLAQRIALSGTLNGPVSSLFIDDTTTVAFEDPTDSAHENDLPRHHVTLDYGEVNPPDLVGFACQSLGTRHNSIWSVWCSNDGEQWENCGVWRSRFQFFKVTWKPRGSRRFWRIEVQLSDSHALFDKLSLFEYTGPSIYLENSTALNDGLDPSILWEKTSANCNLSPMCVSAHVGMAVAFDTKKTAAHIIGVRLVRHGQANSSTEFVVECSTNATTWQLIGAKFLLRGHSAQAAWEGSHYCRFWRLRIVRHTGQPFLALREICFETCRPSLYRVAVSTNTTMGTNDCELSLGDDLQEVVAVEAVLPPCSMYAVEKLSIDGATWEEVATLENNDIISSQTVRQGWLPRGLSSNWRLRPGFMSKTVDDNHSSLTVSQQLDKNARVQWYTFTGKTLEESKINENSNMQVITSGFIEEQAPRRLMDNLTDTVVLSSVERQTTASVTWIFDEDTMPLFHQVSLGGRVVTNPDVQLTVTFPCTPPSQRKASNTNKSSRKTKRQKLNSNSGLGSENVDGTTVSKTETNENEMGLTVVVETSDNGVDYVPLAGRLFSPLGNALSWPMGATARYWRIRFYGILESETLLLLHVAWFVERGVTSLAAPQGSCLLSQSMHNTWQSAAFNHEKEFCKMCREGYEQARSVASGLREPNDIEPHGRVAQCVAALKGEFVVFVAKTLKEASKDKNPPEDKFVSIGRPLNNDMMYLLCKAAIRYNCNVDELNGLVSHPMLFSRNVMQSTDVLSWFYPKFEQGGTLAESFYGFQNVRASLSVLWSLSLQLQRNTDLLSHPSMNPLSPHLATVLITVNLLQGGWVAAERFPGLPLLYHAGFSGRPIVVVFTLNPITFTSQYNLSIPGADPFPVHYPLKLYAGVNFIQRMPLTLCSCPVFDCLQLLYSKEFLAKHETEVVFTAPSMTSETAVVRFTLPGEGINFGISGLKIGSIEFEVRLTIETDEVTDSDVTEANLHDFENQDKMVMFVTHDTIFQEPSVDELPMPIALAGRINSIRDKIVICGISPSAYFPVSCCFQDAFLTNLSVSCEVTSGETPRSFVEPTFTVEGTLVTPLTGSYTCRFLHARLNRTYETVLLHMVGRQLGELIQLGDYILGSSAPKMRMEKWLCTVPISFSLDLEIHYPKANIMGRGTMMFSGFQGDAEVVISQNSLSITGIFTSVRIGGISLHGKSPDTSVVLGIRIPLNTSATSSCSIVRLDGYSRLLTPKLYPTKVEISEAGVVCVSSGVFYDVCIEENSLFPSGMYAQVSLSKSVIARCLSELLQETPLMVAILSKGVPFAFDVEAVVAGECLLERQLLFFSVRGVLLGSRFDVTTAVACPDNTLQEARRVCHSLLPRIVEQCDASLWASYGQLAGHPPPATPATPATPARGADGSARCGSQSDGGEGAFGAHATLKRRLLRSPEGRFLAPWMSRECEAQDVDARDEFDQAAHEALNRSLDALEATGSCSTSPTLSHK